jgi:hypothetical protein
MALDDNLDLKQLPGRERVLSGMRSPQIVTLQVGEVIYRYASTVNNKGMPVPTTSWAAGPWWIRDRDYQRIVTESQRSGMTHGFVARTANAVQQSYSKVDAVVEAVVIKEINAFAGRGQTQYREMAPNGMYITLAGWADVTQLYIPNIADRGGLTPLFSQAFQIRRQQTIDSQQFYAITWKP